MNNDLKKTEKRGFKKRFIIIFFILILIFLILGFIYVKFPELITKKSNEQDINKPSTSPSQVEQNPLKSSSTTSTNPGTSSSSSSNKNTPPKVDCNTLIDTYQLPDFNNAKSLLEKQPIIKDFPDKGSMRLKFFHFTQGCRIWDKTYYISGGDIIEKDQKADIDVWIHTKYIFRLNDNNLCDLIIEARKNDDLGDWTELGKTTLMWRYKSLIKYKECLGVKV